MTARQEKGTVIKVGRYKAEIQMDEPAPEVCEGCSCGLCSGMSSSTARTMEVDKDSLQEGDRVLVKVPQHSGALSMTMLFVVPMALFVLGMIAGITLIPGDGGLPVLIGLLGLVGGFGLAGLIERFALRGTSVEVRRLATASATQTT